MKDWLEGARGAYLASQVDAKSRKEAYNLTMGAILSDRIEQTLGIKVPCSGEETTLEGSDGRAYTFRLRYDWSTQRLDLVGRCPQCGLETCREVINNIALGEALVEGFVDAPCERCREKL